jgi:hypothetical protein
MTSKYEIIIYWSQEDNAFIEAVTNVEVVIQTP